MTRVRLPLRPFSPWKRSFLSFASFRKFTACHSQKKKRRTRAIANLPRDVCKGRASCFRHTFFAMTWENRVWAMQR